jgi:hypothetical protein
VSADAVLMIRPSSFGYNPETAASNRFQREVRAADLNDRARAEVEGVAQALDAAGIRVCLVEDPPDPPRPDAVFPNNWVGFHPGGVVALYAMEAPSRRAERRMEVVDEVIRRTGFVERRRLDFSPWEARGRFLEGTGSLVLDDVARVAYACRSSRTDPELAHLFALKLGYDLELFDAIGPDGRPVYHTNVILAVGERWAVLADGMVAEGDRARIRGRLAAGGRDVVSLDQDQVLAFAGNVLELAGPIVVLSTTALRALRGRGLATLERHAGVVPVDVPTIEQVGGGGVRCMLCEVHVDRAAAA